MTDALHQNYVFIRRAMVQAYDLGQLKLLCGDLDIPADHLPHDTAPALAAALLRRMDQEGRRAELIAGLREERPHVNWPDNYAAPSGAVEPEPGRYIPSPPPDPSGPLPDPGPLPPGSRLPYGRNRLFTGRAADLLALWQDLSGVGVAATPTPDRSGAVVLCGLGGVGKTQLAVEFAHRYGRFFHGVHWLSLADPAAAESEVVACGREMGLLVDGLAPDQAAAFVLREWAAGGPRLLLFDNCEEPALLLRWRPASGAARVLATARNTVWPPEHVWAYPLGVLPRPEAVALLRGYLEPAGRRETDETLGGVAAALGGLPLALTLAGHYLARYRGQPVADYLAALARADDLLPIGRGAVSATGHDLSVRRTFAVSYDRLRPEADEVDGAAAALLARAACFAPGEPLPEALLLATLPTEPPTLAEDGRERLLELGLLERVAAEEAVEESYRLHRLIARFVGEEGSRKDAKNAKEEGEVNEARAAVEAAVISLAYEQNVAGNPQSLRTWDIHLRHISDAAFDREDNTAATLCTNLGYYLKMIGDLAGARPYFERALAVWERVLGPDHPSTATSLNNLGSLLQDQGDLAGARPYYERALAVWERVLGPDHPATALSLNNLGGLLYAQGDLAGARPYFERALAVRERVLGPDHPDTAGSLNNLGFLLQAQGDLAGARPYYERALAVCERALGPDHPDTAQGLNNLGFLLQDLGDLAGARPYYERALAIFEARLGPEHPHTKIVRDNLARLG